MSASVQNDAVPEEIFVSCDRSKLGWREGTDRREFSAEQLRLFCRCAWCTRDRLIDQFPNAFSGITISSVAPIGDHALHISFSDGHARGIFPFRYLYEIALDEVSS